MFHDSEAVAQLLTELLGRPIRAERSDPAQAAPSGAPIGAMFKHYDRVGLVGNALTLSAILGRAPRTLQQFFRELSAGSYPRRGTSL